MRKYYEEPVIDFDKFQFEDVMGISEDDPSTEVSDPFDDFD